MEPIEKYFKNKEIFIEKRKKKQTEQSYSEHAQSFYHFILNNTV